MKKAKLHDGRVLEFPDTHTPEMVQNHVKELLKKEAKEKQDKENKEKADRDKKDDDRHKEHTKALGDVGKTMASSVEGIGKYIQAGSTAINSLSKKLDGIEEIGEIGEALKSLAGNIGSLEKSLKASTDAIIKVLKAPRKIEHSTKGRPIGMRIEE